MFQRDAFDIQDVVARRTQKVRAPHGFITILLCSAVLAGCGGGSEDRSTPFEFSIDSALESRDASLPGLDGGPERTVGILAAPSGNRVEFIQDELIFRPEDSQDLADFLQRYNGTVLRDGTVPLGDDVQSPDAASSSGWYLIRIDPDMSDPADMRERLQERAVGGAHVFSSTTAASTAAIMARESGRNLRPNFLMRPSATFEHPTGGGQYTDAETWPWMTEDDDPNLAGDQGLSVGVVQAWNYLDYLDVPPSNGTFEPPTIAIIDAGFALDASGNPTDGNLDYFPSRPQQYDLVDYDISADGPNLMTCGGSPCPWHGTGAFGVALARHGNQYGGAGTAGNVAWPMLIRVDGSFYTIANGILTAALNGADVISLSLGGGCPVDVWICSLPPDDIYETMQNAIDYAVTGRAVVLAAAGNEGDDLATLDNNPCELARVICVGSVDSAMQNVFNYGAGVDIWAPTNVYSTVSPDSAAADNDSIGVDELYRFGGTSASTPFVAGIVGLMKALDPDITWDRVQNILQQTANPGADSRVSAGYVDAYRAVLAVRENPQPGVVIVSPADGTDISYRATSFTADATDPDNEDPDTGTVVWTSSVDGELCVVAGFYYAGLANQCSPTLSIGTHVITADAVDAHGASMQDAVTVEAINHAPTVIATPFATDREYYSTQTLTLGAQVNDEDEGPPFAQDRLTWTSDLDGTLGTGTGLEVTLSTGLHQLTATATDELGLTAQDTITLQVLSGAGVPSVTIIEPTVGAVGPDTLLTFRGTATDPEDGTLQGASLVWRSSIDGELGTGSEIQAILSDPPVACNPETVRHTISLQATDSDGHVVTETTQVSVGIIC